MARAAAYLAVAVHSMKALQDSFGDRTPDRTVSQHCTVSCLGSVIEKYPGFMQLCQSYLDGLQATSAASDSPCTDSLRLAVAAESSLTGVAVAALMARYPRHREGTLTVPGTIGTDTTTVVGSEPLHSEAVDVNSVEYKGPRPVSVECVTVEAKRAETIVVAVRPNALGSSGMTGQGDIEDTGGAFLGQLRPRRRLRPWQTQGQPLQKTGRSWWRRSLGERLRWWRKTQV